ncbi:6000_t:CDS:2 [Funneliformis geosporum]|uniref:8651_t:CDS:1 n=1 Tax=Funneliformis geosporum TaxID=1117311 RepID=A0A9W4WIF8_9GLOM|nr:8651_t:CDS:2 [Funneliformis geosporum]CAI2166267.1 6000_t:CDS:2 [Funneliformis geosporum]
MDFYCATTIEEWACVKLTDISCEFSYTQKKGSRDPRQLEAQAGTFGLTRIALNSIILFLYIVKKDYAHVNVENLRIKQVNQLATGDIAILKELQHWQKGVIIDMKNGFHTNDEDVKSIPLSPSQDYYIKDPEFFDKLVDDLILEAKKNLYHVQV